MTEIVFSENGNAPLQAVYAPLATEVLTTAGAGAVKTAAALTHGLYRITSTVEVSFKRGAFATTVATANDATLPATPHVEEFGVKDGDTISFFDAGAGGGTVKLSKV